jgi:hypothetical protein
VAKTSFARGRRRGSWLGAFFDILAPRRRPLSQHVAKQRGERRPRKLPSVSASVRISPLIPHAAHRNDPSFLPSPATTTAHSSEQIFRLSNAKDWQEGHLPLCAYEGPPHPHLPRHSRRVVSREIGMKLSLRYSPCETVWLVGKLAGGGITD